MFDATRNGFARSCSVCALLSTTALCGTHDQLHDDGQELRPARVIAQVKVYVPSGLTAPAPLVMGCTVANRRMTTCWPTGA